MSNKTEPKGKKKPPITTKKQTSQQPIDKQVEQYLLNNPDFFCNPKREKLLESISIPHNQAGHISLLEYQIMHFRKINNELVEQIKHLLFVQEANEKTRSSFVAILNYALQANTLNNFLKGFEKLWQQSFNQITSVKILASQSPVSKLLAKDFSCLSLMSKQKPVEVVNASRSCEHQLGNTLSEDLQTVFNNDTIKSFLLLPGYKSSSQYFLLLGSDSPKRFVPGLNAEVAMVAARACLQRFHDLINSCNLEKASTGKPITSTKKTAKSKVKKTTR